jgi:cation transport regulator ChaC
VTLVASPGTRCAGVAYRLPEGERAAILAHLDDRERGGYARHLVDVHVARDANGAAAEGDASRAAAAPSSTFRALVFIATEANPEYLGPAPVLEIAAQIRRARGPSGPNVEYALRLAEALRALEAEDRHVFEIAEALAG